MNDYNETQAKKELENLLNELFVNDFKFTLGKNQESYQIIFDRFKQELKEIIKEDLVGHVDKTMNDVKSSYEGIISESQKREEEFESKAENYNKLIQEYDKRININIIESKGILSETSQKIDNIIQSNKTLLYLILGINSVSLVLSVLGLFL